MTEPILREVVAQNQQALATWAERCPDNYRHRADLLAAERARAEGQARRGAGPVRSSDRGGPASAVPARRGAGLRAGRALPPGGGPGADGPALPAAGARRLRPLGRGGQGRRARRGVPRAGRRSRGSRPPGPRPPATRPARPPWTCRACCKATETPGGGGGARPAAGEADRRLPGGRGRAQRRAGAGPGKRRPAWRCAPGAPSPSPSRWSRPPWVPRGRCRGRWSSTCSRSGEPVVLGDAARQGDFTADPYIVGPGGVKSALAMPIRAARPVGGRALPGERPGHARLSRPSACACWGCCPRRSPSRWRTAACSRT